jgi:NADH-quinone oxidoreductase subunit C
MEIATRLLEQFPDEIIDVYDFQGQAVVISRRDRIMELLQWLRDTPEIEMDHLMDLCGVDNLKREDAGNLERFEVVYNLYSISRQHSIRIRAQVPRENPCIESATSLWSGVDWMERECFDLVGISFTNHPDMRRILLPDDWPGHPLQKEYPLKGAEEWPGMEDLYDQVEKLQQYDFYQQDKSPASSGQDQIRKERP